MKFDEWWEQNQPPTAEEIDRQCALLGWNAALQEAIWIIETSGSGGASDNFIKGKIEQLRAKK